MKITIFQINRERDKNKVAFMRFNHLPTLQHTPDIDSSLYDRVFSNDVPCTSLEDVYRMFNVAHPDEYRARSLSVSDVVQIEDACDGDIVKNGFYYCDSIGWHKVDFDPDDTTDSEYLRTTDKSPVISVLLVKPGATPEPIEMKNNLETMQHLVDGFIELYMPFDDEVAIICNEEGKINGLPLNRGIYDDNGNLIDIIAGNFIIAKAAWDSEYFDSLSDDLSKKYQNQFARPERFMQSNQGIVAIPYDPA